MLATYFTLGPGKLNPQISVAILFERVQLEQVAALFLNTAASSSLFFSLTSWPNLGRWSFGSSTSIFISEVNSPFLPMKFNFKLVQHSAVFGG